MSFRHYLLHINTTYLSKYKTISMSPLKTRHRSSITVYSVKNVIVIFKHSHKPNTYFRRFKESPLCLIFLYFRSLHTNFMWAVHTRQDVAFFLSSNDIKQILFGLYKSLNRILPYTEIVAFVDGFYISFVIRNDLQRIIAHEILVVMMNDSKTLFDVLYSAR